MDLFDVFFQLLSILLEFLVMTLLDCLIMPSAVLKMCFIQLPYFGVFFRSFPDTVIPSLVDLRFPLRNFVYDRIVSLINALDEQLGIDRAFEPPLVDTLVFHQIAFLVVSVFSLQLVSVYSVDVSAVDYDHLGFLQFLFHHHSIVKVGPWLFGDFQNNVGRYGFADQKDLVFLAVFHCLVSDLDRCRLPAVKEPSDIVNRYIIVQT